MKYEENVPMESTPKNPVKPEDRTLSQQGNIVFNLLQETSICKENARFQDALDDLMNASIAFARYEGAKEDAAYYALTQHIGQCCHLLIPLPPAHAPTIVPH